MSFEPQDWNETLDIRAREAGEKFAVFVKTIAALRHPQSGCPWDLEQDHQSLRRFMLEEAYEAAEAMIGPDDANLLEELGDVLLQVVLNAQLAAERGAGDIRHVLEGINSKMLRRHPHVFEASTEQVLKPAEVKRNWEEIKRREKHSVKGYEQKDKSESLFASEHKTIPALTQAYKIGKKARSIDFDWDQPQEVLNQLRSELFELEAEMHRGDRDSLRIELGDVFFSLAQLSRHLDFEPEAIAQLGNSKFLQRFSRVEALAIQRGQVPEQLSRQELEKLWLEAKTYEK